MRSYLLKNDLASTLSPCSSASPRFSDMVILCIELVRGGKITEKTYSSKSTATSLSFYSIPSTRIVVKIYTSTSAKYSFQNLLRVLVTMVKLYNKVRKNVGSY